MNQQRTFFAVLVTAMLFGTTSQLHAQETTFFTDFEFGGEVDFGIFEVSELNNADGQVGEWTADDALFPDGDPSGHSTPDSAGIVSNPRGGTLLFIDRPVADHTLFANSTDTISNVGAEISLLAGTRRTGGAGSKDYDIFGLDEDGNESFRIRIGTDGTTERLGYVIEDTVFFDLPTTIGNDSVDDIANTGGPPFGTGDDIVELAIRLGEAGYVVALNNLNGSNAYTTDVLPYNGDATELAQVGIFYQGVEGATGQQSGFILDSIEVTGLQDLLVGDFNFDGQINMDDFLVMVSNFHTGTKFEQGDMNFDATIDLQDFFEFKSIFPAQGQAATATAVPEPSNLAVIGLGVLLILARRRRHVVGLVP